jgi:hypothetical protein
MILDVHGEMALATAKWDSFRHGPAGEGAMPLEPEVVVEPPRRMPLNDEAKTLARRLRVSERLRRLAGLPAPAVLVEAHLWIVA